MGKGTSIGGGPLVGVSSSFQLAQVARIFLGGLRELADGLDEQLVAFEGTDVEPERLEEVRTLLEELQNLRLKTAKLVDDMPETT